jgi:hypothetical protein
MNRRGKTDLLFDGVAAGGEHAEVIYTLYHSQPILSTIDTDTSYSCLAR